MQNENLSGPKTELDEKHPRQLFANLRVGMQEEILVCVSWKP